MDICIDFDGTCVTHEFPLIGKDIGAIPILKRLVEKGHRLILFTMRSNVDYPESNDKEITTIKGHYLTEAIDWFKDNDIPLYGIQSNPTQANWTHSPKAYGQLYIDDAALGIPLVYDSDISQKPFVDWKTVERLLMEKELL